MDLTTLHTLTLSRSTQGRPSSTLTDKAWQQELAIRKLFITPHKNMKRLSGGFFREDKINVKEYRGVSNWQSYCAYINDVLKNIRAGKIDWCYFDFQILDLLKFHYNDLSTRYCEGYWEVWLER